VVRTGCGLGLTSIVVAGCYPAGAVHAIDAYAPHIGAARVASDDAGTANATFHSLDFAVALERDLPQFQYIVAHGVYSWINDGAKLALRRFIDRHLAPGGLVYVSYNAMPGWASDLPFQHLARALAADEPGDSNAQFAAAASTIQALKDAGAGALLASPMATQGWESAKETLPKAYFAHEYLVAHWRPLYVDEVRAFCRSTKRSKLPRSVADPTGARPIAAMSARTSST
jgi:trans-aconitate methyltransferase